MTDAPTVTFLNDIAAQGLVPDPDYITDEDLYRLRQERRVVVPPSTMSLAASPRKHARAAMGNGGGGCACGCTHDTLPAGGPCEDLIGCECERVETLPADHPCYQRLSCQATQEWVRHPPYLQNALKGDVILVGGCGFVGQMLR